MPKPTSTRFTPPRFTHTHSPGTNKHQGLVLRAQLNKPNTHTKSGTHAGRETPLVGLRGRRRERRSQAEGQRTKVGEESVDGIPVRRAAKRPPELQVTTHFEDGVSRTSKRHLLNDKLIANRPQRPSQHPNAQPSNMSVAWMGGLDFHKQVGEVGVAPISTNRLSKAAPNKLSSHPFEGIAELGPTREVVMC